MSRSPPPLAELTGKVGQLTKQADTWRDWRPRRVLLDGSTLWYWRDYEHEARPSGAMSLKGASVSERRGDNHSIEVTDAARTNTWTLGCKSRTEQLEWLEAVRACVAAARPDTAAPLGMEELRPLWRDIMAGDLAAATRSATELSPDAAAELIE